MLLYPAFIPSVYNTAPILLNEYTKYKSLEARQDLREGYLGVGNVKEESAESFSRFGIPQRACLKHIHHSSPQHGASSLQDHIGSSFIAL